MRYANKSYDNLYHTVSVESPKKTKEREKSARQKALTELCLNCTKPTCTRKCAEYKAIEQEFKRK